MAEGSVCRHCFHSYVCEQFNEHRDSGWVNKKCHFFNDHFVNVENVVEVKHGKWKKVSEKYPRYACTNCHHLFNNKEYKYCPYCGAKMDGRSETDGKL